MDTVKSYLLLFGITDPDHLFSSQELEYISDTLSHKKENLKNDKGNWNAQFEKSDFQRAYLDRFVLDKLKTTNSGIKPIWQEGSRFAVALTHDVDRIDEYQPRSFLRTLSKRIKHSETAVEKIKWLLIYAKTSIKSVFYRKTDPLWHFEDWIKLEEHYGVKSTYFFYVMPDQANVSIYDCDYSLEDKFDFQGKKIKVAEYIKYLEKRGFEIGLHGSFNTWNQLSLFSKQLEELNKLTTSRVRATRQHYLHYDRNSTLLIHQKKIKIDSTLGYTDDIGFRAGTCYPYYLFDKTSSGHPVLEVPLQIMDVAFLNDIPKERFTSTHRKNIDKIISEVKLLGGVLTINFHPNYLNNQAFMDAYKYIIEKCLEEKAVFMTLSEIERVVKSKLESSLTS